MGPSTTLLAIPLQVNEGPDLQFFLALPKSSGFSHHGRQRTPAQSYEKFRYQSTHIKFSPLHIDDKTRSSAASAGGL